MFTIENKARASNRRGKNHGNSTTDACVHTRTEILIALFFLFSVVGAMAKRSLNETVFGIHGVNPSFSAREEPSQLPIPKTTGKIILKR